jgi:uncharacterized protein YbjT (DUF2867 family)
VAAKVLTEEGHEGAVYTLTGPAAISFYEVAEALRQARLGSLAREGWIE